jgi:hypothetical protein
MSFLAVLRAEGEDGAFTVPLCHVNLWSLDALGPRRTLVLDLGLTIQAAEKPVSCITVALPVGTSDRVEDLASKVLDTDLAGLIFDKEVTKPEPAVIRFDDAPTNVVRVKTTTSGQAEAHRSRDFSVWTLQFATPLDPGRAGYLRVRFAVTGSGRTWQWQRNYLARTGALVDFRICDVRGTATVLGGDELRGRILPIGRVHVFVMVPSWLHQRSASPIPTYVRVLEGSVWAGYLGRAPEIRSRSKLVVYYWREGRPNPPGAPPLNPAPRQGPQAGAGQGLDRRLPAPLRCLVPRKADTAGNDEGPVAPPTGMVSTDDPLRVFIDLARQPDPGSPLVVLKIAAVLATVALVLFQVPIKPGWTEFARDVWHWLARLPTWLSITTGAAVVVFLATRRVQAIMAFWSSVYRAFLRAEAALFRKLPK